MSRIKEQDQALFLTVGSVEEEQETFCTYQVEEAPADASNHPPITKLFQVRLLQHVIQV